MPVGICEALALTLSIGSVHLSENYKPVNMDSYNERNTGLSVECGVNPIMDLEAGFYKNSINKTSFHTGVIIKTNWKSDWKLGTNIGIVTGYNVKVLPILLYARPFIQFKGVRLGYIPPSNISDAVVTFEYSYDF